MKTTQDAYDLIAKNLLRTMPQFSSWEFLQLNTIILKNALGRTITIQKLLDGSVLDIPIGMHIFDIQNAVLFLRENILQISENRIWELTFTLHSDGKINVEYGYKKPVGYEDSDGVMTGDEANASLNSLSSNKNKG